LKDNEILTQRVQTLQQMEAYIGKYYSMNWVRKNVLNQSDEDIKEIDAEIQQEEELAYTHAATQGTMAGVTQTAQQNYLQQYAPNETEEAPTTDNEGDQ
jgi:DNA-binding helix-hairpin-helix protein with protein kinase domain